MKNFLIRFLFSLLVFNLLYDFIDPVNYDSYFSKDYFVYQDIAKINFENIQISFWKYASETTGAYPGYFLFQYFIKLFLPTNANSLYFISLFIFLSTSIGVFFPLRVNNITFIFICISLYPIILTFSALKLGVSISFYILYQRLKYINPLSSKISLLLSIISHPQTLILILSRYILEERINIFAQIFFFVKNLYIIRKKDLQNIFLISFFLIFLFYLFNQEIIFSFFEIIAKKIYGYAIYTLNFDTFIKGIISFFIFFWIAFKISGSRSVGATFSSFLFLIITAFGTHRIIIMIWYLFLIPFNANEYDIQNRNLFKFLRGILIFWGIYRTFGSLALS
ncbi:hypothetical protein [uncultured Prochlorococcus sp.]|uniref:hypothetical protein n=1 Tax=uncultured Prochlorococcus sp. TaxID=159733 RepID=UPI00258D59B5|nr:hypothetical protein [uncultured Prochlorococcus sp.]